MSKWQKINKTEAKNLLNKVLFKTFFHEIKWHDFLEKEFKWLKFEYWLYKKEALLPLVRFKVFGKEKLISLPFCEYGGPIFLKKIVDFKRFKKDILNEFKNIRITFHPKIEIGDSGSDTYTYWLEDIDKINKEDLLKSFRKTLRHSIRSSQKHGLEIKKCSNSKQLKQFYNLYTLNLKRKKTVLYPYPVFRYLYNQPETEIWLAIYKGKVVAGDLFLHYSDTIHHFFNTSNYKYRNLGANYFILWEKIKKSLGGKYKVFDFGAAPKDSTLEIFKKGWRGEEIPLLKIGENREKFLRSSKLIRNIYQLAPGFVLKIASYILIKYRL